MIRALVSRCEIKAKRRWSVGRAPEQDSGKKRTPAGAMASNAGKHSEAEAPKRPSRRGRRVQSGRGRKDAHDQTDNASGDIDRRLSDLHVSELRHPTIR